MKLAGGRWKLLWRDDCAGLRRRVTALAGVILLGCVANPPRVGHLRKERVSHAGQSHGARPGIGFETTGGWPAPPPMVLHVNHLRDMIGTAINWIYDGDGLGLSEPKPNAPAESLVATLGYNMVRFPGGTLARTFDWTKAIDSVRGQGPDYGGQLHVIQAGLPKFKRFATRQAMRVMYTLNISDPPAKTVSLLERWRALAPPGGPDISSVELGNEEYTSGTDSASAARYATLALGVASAVRRVAPQVRIGAVLYWGRTAAWDSVVIGHLGSSADFLIWHRYVPSAPYLGLASYWPTVAAFRDVEQDLQQKLRLIGERRLPIVLGEFNLSYQQDGHHQNVLLPPRFYLLLGDFFYLAVRYDLGGIVKWALATPSWHTYVDINFNGTREPELSVSGAVSRLLNRWLSAQDSVGAVDQPTNDWPRLSVLAGRAADGSPSFVIQNHDYLPALVNLPATTGFEASAQVVLEERAGRFATVDSEPSSADLVHGVQVPPYSISVLTYRRGP